MLISVLVQSESEIALNTRGWKLSRSRDTRVGIVITMIHCIHILPIIIVMIMPTRASRDRDNFHARVFKAISLSENRIKSTAKSRIRARKAAGNSANKFTFQRFPAAFRARIDFEIVLYLGCLWL